MAVFSQDSPFGGGLAVGQVSLLRCGFQEERLPVFVSFAGAFIHNSLKLVTKCTWAVLYRHVFILVLALLCIVYKGGGLEVFLPSLGPFQHKPGVVGCKQPGQFWHPGEGKR